MSVGVDEREPARRLLDRAVAGDRRSVGRLLSLVEAGGEAAAAVTELTYRSAGSAHVVGITGAPGVGKSTITGQLVAHLAASGARPAVLAVDPTSPITGGAVLGDRLRMIGVAPASVFIRSMATRGHAGGLAVAVPGAVRLLAAVGFDPVVIETVGVGQVEVEIVDQADTAVVVVTPGWGDAVQANKAGLLEVADVFAVNKADRPDAEDARRDLELMLDLSRASGLEDRVGRRPAIVMTVATEGTGIAELADAIGHHAETLRRTGGLAARRARRVRAEIRGHLERSLAAAVDAALGEPSASTLVAQAESGTVSPVVAADRVLERLLATPTRA